MNRDHEIVLCVMFVLVIEFCMGRGHLISERLGKVELLHFHDKFSSSMVFLLALLYC